MNTKKIYEKLSGLNFCFYCNVDSYELKRFLIIVIGGLVMASIFLAIGFWLRGNFKNVEDPKLKNKVLELEGEQNG